MLLLERDAELAAVDTLLERGGVLVVEGGAGIGKTSLLEETCRRAGGGGYQVLRGRGSELEEGFAYGVVRQLFEQRLARMGRRERDALLAGPAAPARRVFFGDADDASAGDVSFAVLHGLYWLAAGLATGRPVMLAVDDAHWADAPSLRWIAHLAPRVEDLPLAIVATLRPGDPGSRAASLAALSAAASERVRLRLLSQDAVNVIVRDACGEDVGERVCAALGGASGGNPFYLRELLRGAEGAESRELSEGDLGGLLARGAEGVARALVSRVQRLDPRAASLAQALAVLGDRCELRHAAAMAGLDAEDATRLAAGLVRSEVLASDTPPRFLHPIVREAVEASLDSAERDSAHRAAARQLAADRAPPGRVAAHLLRVRAMGDRWVVACLRDAARAAMHSGAPQAAAELLARALGEPPRPEERIDVLREAAAADAAAGRRTAGARLEEARALASDHRERAEIALEVAETYAALFRWTEAVDVIEGALLELDEREPDLAARLEGQLVVAGLHDARRASRVPPVLARLTSRSAEGSAAEALAVARGMQLILAGRRADEAAVLLEEALARAPARAGNWDTRAALLWSLITAERFGVVEEALEPMLEEVERSGSARGLVAVHSSVGLLRLRLGALPEADAAGRAAMTVIQEGDLGPGLAFAATILAETAIEAGDLAHARALLGLLPAEGWPPGVGTVLIPAARGRLRLAEGRPADALVEFEACAAMFSPRVWGMEMRDVGYLHARSGAVRALLLLGERERARGVAEAEVADVRAFGGRRALGVSLRAAGLAHGGDRGIELLRESVAALRGSPALLERAHSLVELGAALRRSGRRAASREPLGEALDITARCGARPLATRAREELRAAGARPRRDWRRGVEALTPSELRVARLAAAGETNRAIALALYVTVKTIEGHLARAYAKLGITGRAELARALEGEKTRVLTPSRADPRVGDSPGE